MKQFIPEWMEPYMGIYEDGTVHEYIPGITPEPTDVVQEYSFNGLLRLSQAVRRARLAAATIHNMPARYNDGPDGHKFMPVIWLPGFLNEGKYKLYALQNVGSFWFSYWKGMPDAGRCAARMASAVMYESGFTAAYVNVKHDING